MSQQLAVQLEQLELRGRRHLAAEAHRAALSFAATLGARLAVAWALLLTPLAAVYRIDPVVLVLLWIAASVATAAIAYGLRRRGGHVDRGDALALFDRHMASKDRIAASDEFLRQQDRDGYREAAMDEARPWIDRAAAMPLVPGTAARTARRWPFLAVALALLAVALAVRLAGDGRPDRAGVAHITSRGLLAAIREVLPKSGGDERGADAASAGGRETADRRGGGSALSRPAGAGADAARDRAGGAAGQAGAAVDEAGRPSRAAAPAIPAGAPGADRAGSDAGRKDQAAGGQQGGAPSDPQASARDAAEGGAGSDTIANIPGTAIPAGRAPAGSPMPPAVPRAAPAPAPAPQGQNKGGQPETPNRNGGGQKGGQNGNQTQGQGQSQGRGQGSGRGAGQDAVKKSRGTSSLLLAVPMNDRLIGMPNPGRVSSITRPSMPRETSVGQVAAQDRGRSNGDGGPILHRTDTRHDELLVRDFFRIRRGHQQIEAAR